MIRIVSELESVNSREVIDFATQQDTILPQRHKEVTDLELDRLASKNNAESTVYQTRWAITVFKGIIFHLSALISSKIHKT